MNTTIAAFTLIKVKSFGGREMGRTRIIDTSLDKTGYDPGSGSAVGAVSKFRQSTVCVAALRVVVAALGLALGACSKCDVPNLLPHQAAPQSCNDAPPPQ